MKRITVRLAIGALTFVIGVMAAAVLTITRHSGTNHQTGSLITANSMLGFCDLIQNPNRYESQSVRVAAILVGYHEIALYDPSCKSEDNYVRADFDAASRQQLIEGIQALNGAGFQRGNFWANVILAGQFQEIPEGMSRRVNSSNQQYINYHFHIVVSDVESVTAVSSDVPWP